MSFGTIPVLCSRYQYRNVSNKQYGTGQGYGVLREVFVNVNSWLVLLFESQ